jgi:16S rRNA (cytidine1402-2'-O)-methyltransferase
MTVSNTVGCVYIVSTPIGNLEDLSPRALRVLREVTLIACEDTRRTGRLCAHFEIRTPRMSLHAHNEPRRLPGLLDRIEAGAEIALVSDSGTPLLSDPGGRLVRAAIERGLPVVPIPGPSAILAGLVASGMATRPFTFVGFLPRKGRARADWLARLRTFPGTIVLFEAPGRVQATLGDLFKVLGPRQVAVARELTKRFEEVARGRLGQIDLPEPRGEVTLVVEGDDPVADASLTEKDEHALLSRLVDEGHSVRDAARELAELHGISRSDAYRRVLAFTRSADLQKRNPETP